MVHNNGFGDRADKWEFSERLAVIMENDEMIHGTIMTFPLLTNWVIKPIRIGATAFGRKLLDAFKGFRPESTIQKRKLREHALARLPA